MQKTLSSVDKENVKLKRKSKLKKGLFMASFLAWPILNFFVFYVYVHLDSFTMAFQSPLPNGEVEWTFKHFVTVWESLSGLTSGGRNIGIGLRNTFMFNRWTY